MSSRQQALIPAALLAVIAALASLQAPAGGWAVATATAEELPDDIATGEVIWECGGLSSNIVASPVAADGFVYAGSSYDTKAMLAIRLDGAKGDITGTKQVVWSRRRGTPYVPSPLLYGDTLYNMQHYQGVIVRLDVKTGEERGERRHFLHGDEFPGRLRGEQHVALDLLLGDAARPGGLRDLPLDQRRPDIARADRVRGDALLGDFQAAEGAEPEHREHRDVEILRSLPGVGRVVAATVLAEASTALAARDYHSLRAHAGVAPVTKQSGKRRTVHMRYACDRRLRNALYHWARVATVCDAASRTYYATLRQRGHGHGRALRSDLREQVFRPWRRVHALEDDGRLVSADLPHLVRRQCLQPVRNGSSTAIVKAQPDDPERYQTVYARDPGSAAAPTAGLHFTPELLETIDHERVTLHVGLDTFRPLATDVVEEHELHGER